MRKKHTHIENLEEIILKDISSITKVEMQSDSYTVEEIPIEDFKRDLILFAQSGIFRDSVEFRYVVDDEEIIVSADICPPVGTELRIYMKADEQTVKALRESIFDKLAKQMENNHIQR